MTETGERIARVETGLDAHLAECKRSSDKVFVELAQLRASVSSLANRINWMIILALGGTTMTLLTIFIFEPMAKGH